MTRLHYIKSILELPLDILLEMVIISGLRFDPMNDGVVSSAGRAADF